jgi:hypothetical protein
MPLDDWHFTANRASAWNPAWLPAKATSREFVDSFVLPGKAQCAEARASAGAVTWKISSQVSYRNWTAE